MPHKPHKPRPVRLQPIEFDISQTMRAIEFDITHPMPIIPVVLDTQETIKTGKPISGVQGYGALVRDLVKSSGIYAVASLASPLVSLALAPFLTRSLSSTDYGALVVLNTIITLATGITQLGMFSAIFRAYTYDYESQQDRMKVLSTTTILLVLTSLPITIVCIMAAPQLANLLLGSTSFSDSIKMSALSVLMQNLAVPGLAWLRAESRAISFAVLSIINLFIILVANIILIAVLHMGIAGSLLATALGYAFIAIYTLPPILLRAGLMPRLDITRNLLSFGIPLVFNNISYWILQLSDRYLLSRLGSLAQVASYGVAYSLGGIVNVVIVSPFILAWATATFSIAKREDAQYVFQLVFRWVSIVLLLAGFIFAFIAIFILDMLFPPSYHSAAPVISIVDVSIVLFGIYTIFTVGPSVQRKMWFVALIMTLSALVNLACNFVLIPLYGSMGAALSTLIAYIFLTMIMYIVNQRIYPIPFEIGIFVVALFIGIVFYIVSDLFAQNQTIYGACAIYVVSTILYGGCLVLLAKFAARKSNSARRRASGDFASKRTLFS
jgi:O-antigen/teichoic acid export membrane protein